jgi:DNA segregation ATPase FtsK/SpoIIIE-like protein
MGKDAVQHGLLGGNTQMGKSNLLHVLINQLALRYSPAELEL